MMMIIEVVELNTAARKLRRCVRCNFIFLCSSFLNVTVIEILISVYNIPKLAVKIKVAPLTLSWPTVYS